MTLTSICEARAARRPTTSSDASALSGQDVTKNHVGIFGKGSKEVSILVILHYLLKNNITFMCGIGQGKIGGGSNLQSLVIHKGPLPPIGGSFR